MNPTFKNKTQGRLLYQDGNVLYKETNNHCLFKSEDNGKTWVKIYQLPSHTFLDRIGYLHPIFGRLLRKGIHHFNVDQEGNFGLLYNKKVAVLNHQSQILQESNIRGSRPLSFECINNEFVFGEYRSNPERSPIGAYSIDVKKALYRKLKMRGIRHIHGIYQDPYTQQVWITTGDFDNEAALYCSDSEFKKVEKVLYGSQQTRAIKILFTEKHIYFGSDAPDEVNYIYRVHRETKEVEQLAQVGSSVFHGTQAGDWLFFSTAIEPSKVNTTKYAEVWASPNGVEWKCILKMQKDFWSMKYFQYGQIFFPAGKGNNKNIWFSPFATEGSNMSYKLSIEDVRKLFDSIKK